MSPMTRSKMLLLSIVASMIIVPMMSVIAPTSNSKNIENYINSESDNENYFYSGIINCGTTICNIGCDEFEGCHDTVINTDTLTTTLNISCSQSKSCYNMNIYADSVANIDIKCNWNNQSSTYETGSCYNMTLYAKQSGNTNLYCVSNNCYQIDFYLNDAMSSIINADGDHAIYDSNFYADRMKKGLNITCHGIYACYESKFYTSSMSSNVSLLCYGDHACGEVDLNGGTMTGDVSVTCKGDLNNTGSSNSPKPCLGFRANTNQIAGSLTVDCVNPYGCYYVYVYCPLTSCNINCLDDVSCTTTNFYIDNQFDANYFHLNCDEDNSKSCYNAWIRCTESGGASYMIYGEYGRGPWICKGYGCCPYHTTEEDMCIEGQPCLINCDESVSCMGHNINAQKATSLTLDCTEVYSCQGAKIECPSVDGASCSINCNDYGSCAYSYIVAGNGNTMNKFELKCMGDKACEGMYIALNATDISTVNIDCTGNYVEDVYSGCSSLQMITKANINTINIGCSQYGCENAQFELGTADKVAIDCNGYQSCYNNWGSQTSFKGITDDLSVSCEGTQSCYGMNIEYVISNNNFILDCFSQESCHSMDINLHLAVENANITINCIDIAHNTAQWDVDGTCQDTTVYIYGYNDSDSVTNNVSIQCDEYDCRNTQFYIYDAYYADVMCNGPYGCDNMYLEADTSKYLYLDCNDTRACQDASIHCPYNDVGVCNLHCSWKGWSCDSEIYVKDSYVYGYLDLECDSSDACDDLKVNCIPGSRSSTWIEVNYNAESNVYGCFHMGDLWCCPYYNTPSPTSPSPTPYPSRSPTAIATKHPTRYSTSNPTITSTSNPTMTPTSQTNSSSNSNSSKIWIIILSILSTIVIVIGVIVVAIAIKMKRQKKNLKGIKHIQLIKSDETEMPTSI